MWIQKYNKTDLRKQNLNNRVFETLKTFIIHFRFHIFYSRDSQLTII